MPCWRRCGAPRGTITPIKHAARLARHRPRHSSPFLRHSARNVAVPLDEFLPDYDVNEVHSTRVAAPPDLVLTAVRELTSRDAPLVDQFTRGGFVVLAERPDELVVGAVGRFWTSDGGVKRVSGADFVAFDAPGYAKAVMNFHARAVSGGTVLTTETRIQGTDEEARRRFRRYWRVVMPGSAAIRRAWLQALRKRAER